MPHHHRFEFWTYLAGRRPKHVALDTRPEFVSLTSDGPPPGLSAVGPPPGTKAVWEEVENSWRVGLKTYPFTNNVVLNLRAVDHDRLSVGHSDYKSILWVKHHLWRRPWRQQEEISRKLAFLNVGVVTITADQKIVIERRPESFTAPTMLLNIPCGHAERGHRTLSDAVNDESSGELGWAPEADDGSLRSPVRDIRSLGLVRESDEWSPVFTFVMHIDRNAADVQRTRETGELSWFPAEPAALLNRLVGAYVPSTKGPMVADKLVPNAVAMMSLYLLRTAGRAAFDQLWREVKTKARAQYGTEVMLEEFTPTTNPFQEW